jgi:hypothetical protein
MFSKVEILTNSNQLWKLKNFLVEEKFPFLIHEYYQKEEINDQKDLFENYQLATNNSEREFEALELEESEDEEDIVNEE